MNMNLKEYLSGKSTFSTEEEGFNALSTTALMAKNSVPSLHKQLANNYVLMKKIYKFPVVKSSISLVESNLLNKYSFEALADTDILQMCKELEIIRDMGNSDDFVLKSDADKLIELRVKELKCIIASHYTSESRELNNGYIALERYFEEISKYN